MELYSFFFSLMCSSTSLAVAHSYIYAFPPDGMNQTTRRYNDREADFGQQIAPEEALIGVLYLSFPVNACTPVVPPLNRVVYPFNNILLVEESKSQHDCPYVLQVAHAQKARYSAVIVYRRTDDGQLKTMKGEGPIIPSVYVSKNTGNELKRQFLHYTGSKIEITSIPQFPLQLYLIPFAVVVGICIFFMIVFSICRYVRFRLKRRRSRLSKSNLKKIPTKKYKKGDEYETCAICIEDYEEHDKIRILPCNHAYHCVCVDPWLTSGKKLCPVCKRTVEPENKTVKSFDNSSTSSHHHLTSDSENEARGGDETNERTPLLSNQRHTHSPSGGIET